MTRDNRDRLVRELSGLSQQDQLDVIATVVATNRHPAADIDVTPFRERFLVRHARDGLAVHTVAERLGWLYGKTGRNGGPPRPDGTRLMRRLGLAAENGGSGYWTVRRHVSYETAVALCDALDLDYTEVGV